MPLNNRIINAAAGAGKTTRLVRDAIAHPDDRILVTTFTINNEAGIRKKFFEECGRIPQNVTIQTWFTLLLHELSRPYQNVLYPECRIGGLVLVNGQSAMYVGENNTRPHYFSDGENIYSDKLAKFSVRCNELSEGAVIQRLQDAYDKIYVDEIQDLAAWDLDILDLLFASEISVTAVGDYRQSTYQTSNASKYKKYAGVQIIDKFSAWAAQGACELESMSHSYRCNQTICDFADRFFPEAPQTESRNEVSTEHDGVFIVRSNQVPEYMRTYEPQVLRYDRRSSCQNLPAVNFGDAKGLGFDRVLIFPHGPLRRAIETGDFDLKAPTKPYVAVTRARFSVGIVHDGDIEVEGVQVFNPEE